jgi:large subunit ribosomal protein L10
MVLKLEGKKTIVDEVATVAARSVSLIAAEYSGLTVGEFTEFRQAARKSNVAVRVVRNTLARRALQDTDFACMNEQLIGPLVLIFSQEDPAAGARLLKDFAKEHENLKVMALALGKQLLPKEQLGQLASLPTKSEAIAQMMSVMLGPVTKLVRTLAAPHTQLVRTVAAVREQKQAAGS